MAWRSRSVGCIAESPQDPIKGPCVAGVSEHEVASAGEVMELLTEGNRRRTQEPTAANKESSRSHAVLQIVVELKDAYATDMKIGKMSLIDLAGALAACDNGHHSRCAAISCRCGPSRAGSERASKTENRGIRLLEGANINRSLLALGNVITSLVQGKGSFVPYRDSK